MPRGPQAFRWLADPRSLTWPDEIAWLLTQLALTTRSPVYSQNGKGNDPDDTRRDRNS
jgi:hypothetical protein